MSKKSTDRSRWPLVIIVLGAVFLLVAAGSFIFFSSNGNPLTPPTQTMIPVGAGDIVRVSAADAYAAQTANQAVIVDVRSLEEYSQSHIEGAISIPLNDLPARMGELDPEDWIVPY
jgi:hypothetical protein